jgi:hypothetical protein
MTKEQKREIEERLRKLKMNDVEIKRIKESHANFILGLAKMAETVGTLDLYDDARR